MDALARQVVATGADAAEVAARIVEGLAAPGLAIALVFSDWRLDPGPLARATHHGLRAPVVGATTTGVIGKGVPRDAISAVGIGLYGDWVRAGIGVSPDLPRSPLTRSREAVEAAATALGTNAAALDPARHVGVTLVDGTCGHEEAFCIGSAATAPQIRFVGGSAATEISPPRRAAIFVNGEVMSDAGVVVLLDLDRAFQAVTSSHVIPTDIKTVVTAASGRVISELDGRPAAPRLRDLVASIGDRLTEPQSSHAFARIIDGVPYVRSITAIEGDRVQLACAVEVGHVLRLMRSGDLIGTTTRDLAAAADRVGGDVAACLAFSCIGRHWDAAARNLDRALAGAYSAYPTVGLQTLGEQTGMLLVNHTLTGLVIGQRRSQA